jgi:hypothetical protein
MAPGGPAGDRPGDGHLRRAATLPGGTRDLPGEQGAASAQELGQLQPFLAAFPAWADLHGSTQPNNFLAPAAYPCAGGGGAAAPGAPL